MLASSRTLHCGRGFCNSPWPQCSVLELAFSKAKVEFFSKANSRLNATRNTSLLNLLLVYRVTVASHSSICKTIVIIIIYTAMRVWHFSAFIYIYISADDLMTEIEAVRCNNQELIQRITEVQMENAELKHQISLLQDYLKTEKGNVKQLECEKESFRVNVNTMSHDLVVQLKLLKLVQKEKEELEKEKTELQGRLQFHEKFENNEFSSIL